MKSVSVGLIGWLLLFAPIASLAQQEDDAAPPPTLASSLQALPKDAPLGADALIVVDPPTDFYYGDDDASDQPDLPDAPDVPLTKLDAIGAKFHLSYRAFGHLAALGPAKITVLSMPDTLTPSAATIPLDDALNIFLGLLNDDQWHAIATGGLSMDQLTDDQTQVLDDLVVRPIVVAPGKVTLPQLNGNEDDGSALEAYTKQLRPVGADALRSAKLIHVYAAGTLSLTDSSYHSVSIDLDSPEYPVSADYRLSTGEMSLSSVPGASPLAKVRTHVPNDLKPADLDLSRSEFSRAVTIGKNATVGSVIADVAKATGLELIVDWHYADRPILTVGDSARAFDAADVVEAIDFSLAATWRKVGPAYVLTDDVDGLAVRQHSIVNAMDHWNHQLSQRVKAAIDAREKRNVFQFVSSPPGGEFQIPPTILAKVLDTGKPTSIRFGDLPPSTQAVFKKRAKLEVNNYSVDDVQDRQDVAQLVASLTAESTLNFQPSLLIAVDLPTLGSVLLTDSTGPASPNFSTDIIETSTSITPKVPHMSLRKALGAVPIGVSARFTDADSARAIVGRLASAGVTFVVCTAFDNGETYFGSKTLPSVNAKHADILRATIDEGNKKHVAVYARVSLLRWRQAGPLTTDRAWEKLVTQDVDILGEPAQQAYSDAQSIKDADGFEILSKDMTGGGWASPSDRRTVDIVKNLLSELAMEPGLAGILITDAVPPGYSGQETFFFSESAMPTIQLGYTDEARLAYLRKFGEDPIDVTPPYERFSSLGSRTSSAPSTVNLDVPYFHPSSMDQASSMESLGWTNWTRYLQWTDDDVLAQILTTLQRAAPGKPILLDADRNSFGDFKLWTGFEKPAPTPGIPDDPGLSQARPAPHRLKLLEPGPTPQLRQPTMSVASSYLNGGDPLNLSLSVQLGLRYLPADQQSNWRLFDLTDSSDAELDDSVGKIVEALSLDPAEELNKLKLKAAATRE